MGMYIIYTVVKCLQRRLKATRMLVTSSMKRWIVCKMASSVFSNSRSVTPNWFHSVRGARLHAGTAAALEGETVSV